jgi:catalase-peroxidase
MQTARRTHFSLIFAVIFTVTAAGAAEPVRAASSARSTATTGAPRPNQFWWPEQLDLSPLRWNLPESNPYGRDFDYPKAFQSLSLAEVKKDIRSVLTTSQDWWPADYGNYGPFFIRMAWHSAGTYRSQDGRGGASGAQQRFEPLNSWPDNTNLDKARRLLWPVKKKYGRKLSWGDLMVLTGNVALDSMGFPTYGFSGGRPDDWEADLVYWGGDKFMGNNRGHDGKLQKPLAATQMGLIYVNPEGPMANADPLAAAKDIREAFGRMGMNDNETVALIAGGHTFGKAHGAHPPQKCVGSPPAGEAVEKQGLGWANTCGSGKGADTVTSGLEGAWTSEPTAWTTQYFDNLLGHDWVKVKGPGGATQWRPKDAQPIVPDAHLQNKHHPLMMFTTDMALKMDPAYAKVVNRFHGEPEAFKLAFAKAWFKLVHRDMGPRALYVGTEVPAEEQIWQDVLPPSTTPPIDEADVAALKAAVLATNLPAAAFIQAAWASASTFRMTDNRGGANGARLRLPPQKDWEVNAPAELDKVLKALTEVQGRFNTAHSARPVSMADLVILAGNAGIEAAARRAGHALKMPFGAGRTDATAKQTCVKAFGLLEPLADGFRNYYGKNTERSPVHLLVDKAASLSLTVPEMTVLLGGLRGLDVNVGHGRHGVLTDRPGSLTNDFFVNLLDMSTAWSRAKSEGVYEGRDRKTQALKWTATAVDLIFGSNAELRAVAEVYAADDAQDKFIQDFVAAWTKVMNLDRFELKRRT